MTFFDGLLKHVLDLKRTAHTVTYLFNRLANLAVLLAVLVVPVGVSILLIILGVPIVFSMIAIYVGKLILAVLVVVAVVVLLGVLDSYAR